MINLLLSILLAAAAVGLIYWAITQITMPEQIRKIILVALVLIVGLWLLFTIAGAFGIAVPGRV